MKSLLWRLRRWMFKKLVGKSVDIVFKNPETDEKCCYVWLHFPDKDVLTCWIVEKDTFINGNPAKCLHLKD